MPLQIPPAVGSSGQFVETVIVTSSQQRHIMVLGDGTSTAYVPVTSSGGAMVTVANPSTSVTFTNAATTSVTVTNISTAVTITNPTTQVNTLSSGPVLVLSSGPMTISGTVAVLSASSGVVQTLDSTSQDYLVFMTITSSAGNLSTTVKGSPGSLKGYSIFNTNAASRYFKLFNTTSAPTLGTDTPVITLLIPGSTAGAGAVQSFDKGVSFSAGISMAITDAMPTTSTGAISANDIAANIYYV